MNAPITDTSSFSFATLLAAAPVFWRFVWKECRRLSGFWLALATLAVGMQVVLLLLAPRPDIAAAWLFAVAWAAAALYAVGAAATLFAGEHDESTYNFLAGLPAAWPPVFWGKATAAAVGAVVMGGVVWLTGFLLSGRQLLDPQYANDVMAVLAPAVLEGLAWGILFSLLLCNPLLAAILAIAAASVSVTILNGMLAPGRLSFLIETYHASVGGRFVMAVVVFLMDVLLARGWFKPERARPPGFSRRWRQGSVAVTAAPAADDDLAAPVDLRPRRRIHLGRLIWQTWRESSNMIVVMVILTAPFVLSVIPALASRVLFTWLMELLPMIPAALAGACVFLADQRQGQYRFLAEHAVRPRYVWFARHVVWIGTGIVIAMLATVFSLLVGSYFLWDLNSIARDLWDIRTAPSSGLAEECAFQVAMSVFLANRLLSTCAVAMFSAYAVGQLASMLLRSGLLAGFTAIVFSMLMATWLAVVKAWDLSLVQFVLPVVVGLFLATWLHAPDWILERRTMRAWRKPLAAVLIPIAAVLMLLPRARLHQTFVAPNVDAHWHASLDEALTEWRAGDTPAARKTADLYVKLSYQRTSWDEVKKKVAPDRALHEQTPAENAKVRRRYLEVNRAVIRKAIAISKRPTCRFPVFGLAMDGEPAQTAFRLEELVYLVREFGRNELSNGALDESLDCFLAVMRMRAHLCNGQPTAFWIRYGAFFEPLPLLKESFIHEGQNSKRLKRAIAEIDRVQAVEPDPRMAVVADYLLLRDVIEEKQMPMSIAPKSRRIPSPMELDRMYDRMSRQLAYLANKLPWERARALKVLDAVTACSLSEVAWSRARFVEGGVKKAAHVPGDFRYVVNPSTRGPRGSRMWRGDWMPGSIPASWLATSYFLANEYDLCCHLKRFEKVIDQQTRDRLGIKLQLALLAYRLDHGAYPKDLDALVPDYVASLPRRPYAGSMFTFLADGLDGVLDLNGVRDMPEEHASLIPAHTPLLWGTNYSFIKIGATRVTVDSDGRAVNDRGRVVKTYHGKKHPEGVVYLLWGTDTWVFPLPRRAATTPTSSLLR